MISSRVVELLGSDERIDELREVGAWLVGRRVTGPDALLALALAYERRNESRPSVALIGRARQLIIAARALEGLADSAEQFGRDQ